MNQPLVSTTWLAEHLHAPNLRIVDIRGLVKPASEPLPHYFNLHEDYLQAHIPNAIFVDWVQEITDPDDPNHAQIAKPARFEAVMRRLGISAQTHVVAYDNDNGMFAARLWWALRYYGHIQVSVLDGGWRKWHAEGHPTDAQTVSVEMGDFVARTNPTLHRDSDAVWHATQSDARIVDVRTLGEFKGQASRARRAGHIPNAVNLPRQDLINPDGTLRPVLELRAAFAAAGIDAHTPEVIFYCNGGVSASYGLLALEVAGYTNGTLYDGSWKDWGNNPTLPIVNEL